MYKNEYLYGVECIDYTSVGEGVFKHNGFPVFVKNALIGEVCDIKIIFAKKKWATGIIVKIIEESPERVPESCSVARQCGGCTIQHMSQAEQKRFKLTKLKNLFKDRDVKIINENNQFRYRNKVQVPYSIDKRFGFYRTNSNSIVEFEDCLIQSEYINEILTVIKKSDIIGFNKEKWVGQLRHVLIRKSMIADKYMVILITYGNPDLSILSNKLMKLEKVISVFQNINSEKNNVIMGDETIHLAGDNHLIDNIGDKQFIVTPTAFFQVNNEAAKSIYDIVRDNLDSTNKVIDAYCGSGTIGIYVADVVDKILGIEVNKNAIADANQNAFINGADNCTFIADDATNFICENQILEFDTLILDPPRKGTTEKFINAVIASNITKVIYVSCNPATLKRDLELFEKGNFNYCEVTGVDMFPQTGHIEAVVVLKRLQN